LFGTHFAQVVGGLPDGELVLVLSCE